MAFQNTRCVVLWLARGVLVLALCLGAVSFAGAQQLADLPVPDGEVILEVHGEISNTNADGVAQYDRAMLLALPHAHIETSTSVTDGVHAFDGFLLRDLLEHVGALGSSVVVTALNNYVIDFPIKEFDDYDIILAYAMDGKQLQTSDKGPLWIVYPRDDHPELQDIRYDYRWVWQVIRLDIQ